MSDVVMPRLSDTMEEGTVLRWLKRDGEEVHRGEELVEIETDKATMTYESDQEGVLQTVAREGDTLAVGELIARIGADAGAAGDEHAQVESPAAQTAEPAPNGPVEHGAERVEATLQTATPEQPAADASASHSPDTGPAAEAPSEAASGRVKASPLARRVARESGVDLAALTGSGPGGRIVKADVQAATERGVADARTATAGAAPTPTPPPTASIAGVATAKGETSTSELSRTQQVIARRMAESKATIPDFALTAEIDMEECVGLRGELKRLAKTVSPAHPAPTYNDMVVKACALALREHPRANGSYRDGRFELHSRVNVGVAVATEDALVVPTVFDADTKSLGEIARETRALAERVRDGSITPPELGGGTFTVSNLGMYGVRSFAAIINPPQAAILSVGSLERRAVVRAGAGGAGSEIVARHTMAVTLGCDHRILYGADAAGFLSRVRELLEQPAALTL